ncbi:MAG TPA: radical SAM protein [Candidatus Saccharimonadaceae bacterium]|jgi:uncharacterized Fe-S cluster-containing radical SAM superfamily protein|nr:radical SAM protein [Candidatus Saccharimonadaceae bacterium]
MSQVLPAFTASRTTADVPRQPFAHLDELWIQVAGTLCNLSCTHCFVSCGPGDARHALMTRAEVAARVAEALPLGVRECYFTGGEPFLHPDLLDILEDTLPHTPCTVLTNGTLFTAARVAALAELGERSRYSLEIRVSLDAPTAPEHDAFRGAGSFERALAGVRALTDAGLVPIVTVTETTGEDPLVLRRRVVAALEAAGVRRARIKLLPLFALGREVGRRGAPFAASLAGLGQDAFDATRLQCGHCRAVTSRGVFVCPLLVDEPGGRMGARLDETLKPFALAHSACVTCYATGMSCANG